MRNKKDSKEAKFVFLCEAGLQIGLGHFKRSKEIYRLCSSDSLLIILCHDTRIRKELKQAAADLPNIRIFNKFELHLYLNFIINIKKKVFFFDGMSKTLNSLVKSLKVKEKIILSPRLILPPEPCIAVNRSDHVPPIWKTKDADKILLGSKYTVISQNIKNIKFKNKEFNPAPRTQRTSIKSIGLMLGAFPSILDVLTVHNLFLTFRNRYEEILFCYLGPIPDEMFKKIFYPYKVSVIRDSNPWRTLVHTDLVVSTPGISLSEAIFLEKNVIVLLQKQDQLHYVFDHLANPLVAPLYENNIFENEFNILGPSKTAIKVDEYGANRILHDVRNILNGNRDKSF